MAAIDPSKYSHSPVHRAVLARDYSGLNQILSSLPRLADPSTIKTEATSIVEEKKAEAISAVIDRRDVPNRETPLHLAVMLGDATSTEMLMAAGADWSLQNEQGWSALQEAICARQENLAKIIIRHYQPLAWAKWCRRLPRVVNAMRGMRDFYLEITFHLESSVIPFISRLAPSDTCKIWKRGSNLRADMTLAGFDGFRIQRSDQSVVFLGDGSRDGKVPPGTLCVVSHKDKQVMNALEGEGGQASETEVQQEVSAMLLQADIFRPGIDVTQAVLVPQLNWRRQQKMEMVGQWKARVYDMHHMTMSVKSRKVAGAVSDEEDSSSTSSSTESEDYYDNDLSDGIEIPIEEVSSNEAHRQDRERWFDPRSSIRTRRESEKQSEYKKGLRPVLWLAPDFPLRTEELLPLLDILANKAKAIRRLRDLLATKLPPDTFPVKVAVPVVPTIRLLITFTKFEEVRTREEFSRPDGESIVLIKTHPNSWLQWMKVPYQQTVAAVSGQGPTSNQDPFLIPPDYTWITPEEAKKKKLQETKGKPKKAKNAHHNH